MSLPYFRVLKRPHAGLALIVSESHAQVFQQLWTRARLRKPARCAVCDVMMPTGAQAFRPVTNYDNRSVRVEARHVEEAMEVGA